MTPAKQARETHILSHRYLRVAMVGLLSFLGLAVFDQTLGQKEGVLSSISAYYYTPAQAVFVGTLIAIGVCMIALQGTTDPEDILLNIGGMLAPVVALIPTARSTDTSSALEACRQSPESFTFQGMPIDCTLENLAGARRALEGATRLAIENNVPALVYTGGAAMLAAVALNYMEKNPKRRIPDFMRYWSAAFGLYLVGAGIYFVWTDEFVKVAHYFAAGGLFACIVGVAIVNAFRKKGEDSSSGSTDKTMRGPRVLFPNLYAAVAIAMLVAIVVGLSFEFWGPGNVALFWLEATLILLFAALWVIQTREQWN